MAASLEALGERAAAASRGAERIGIVLCTMCGCVRYSRRFYDETLNDPTTASPLVFPETVFNAPASHLAALLGLNAVGYTLLGDNGVVLQGLALAADWLRADCVDGCLVVAAEELDWIVADAYRLFSRHAVLSEGAAALYLRREPSPSAMARLASVTSPYLFCRGQPASVAAQRMRAELPESQPGHLLCDGLQRVPRLDAAEAAAWRDWQGPRLSPKVLLGEGLTAAAGWQCVAAVESCRRGVYTSASVSVVGCNEQAIGARFEIAEFKSQIAHSPP